MSATDLMQPTVGSGDWTDLALCQGDDRFIKDNPTTGECRAMAAVCRECEVFFQCLDFHDPPGEEWTAIGVFAAGEFFDYEEIP